MLKKILLLSLTLFTFSAFADATPFISCRLENAENDPSNQRLNFYEMDNGQVVVIWRSLDFIKTGTFENGVQDVTNAFKNKTNLIIQKSRYNPAEVMNITFGPKYTRVVFANNGGKTDLICHSSNI